MRNTMEYISYMEMIFCNHSFVSYFRLCCTNLSVLFSNGNWIDDLYLLSLEL